MPRQTWTQEEDDVLKRLRRENPKCSWDEIIKKGNLEGKTPKGCSHRWHNFLKSDFKGGEFSPEEDEQIINLKRRGESWASMAKDRLLEQRSANAIKNRWNNHLKKTPEGIMILSLIDLMDDEASDHSVSEDDLEARMAEFQLLI